MSAATIRSCRARAYFYRRALPLALAGCVFHSSGALARSDGDFIREAIGADITQIEAAKLAQQRAASGAVRGLANELMAGRMREKREASQLAESLRAHVPTAPSEDGEAQLRRLASLQGPAFDKAFVGYTIADHKKRIESFEIQSKDKSAATATFAEKTLPRLRDHLKRAETLALPR